MSIYTLTYVYYRFILVVSYSYFTPSSVLISSPPIKALPFPPLIPLAHLYLAVSPSIAPCSEGASFDFLAFCNYSRLNMHI